MSQPALIALSFGAYLLISIGIDQIGQVDEAWAVGFGAYIAVSVFIMCNWKASTVRYQLLMALSVVGVATMWAALFVGLALVLPTVIAFALGTALAYPVTFAVTHAVHWMKSADDPR